MKTGTTRVARFLGEAMEEISSEWSAVLLSGAAVGVIVAILGRIDFAVIIGLCVVALLLIYRSMSDRDRATADRLEQLVVSRMDALTNRVFGPGHDSIEFRLQVLADSAEIAAVDTSLELPLFAGLHVSGCLFDEPFRDLQARRSFLRIHEKPTHLPIWREELRWRLEPPQELGSVVLDEFAWCFVSYDPCNVSLHGMWEANARPRQGTAHNAVFATVTGDFVARSDYFSLERTEGVDGPRVARGEFIITGVAVWQAKGIRRLEFHAE